MPTSPISDRIRAYIYEERTTQSALSLKANMARTQLGNILRTLDAGGEVGHERLEQIAKACGRSLAWLLTGAEAEALPRLRDLPQWAPAALAAIERYHLDPKVVAAVGDWRVPAPPAHLDDRFVAALARAFADAGGGR